MGTIPSQSGVFSFAEQSAKVGKGGTFDASALSWTKVRAPRVSMGIVQDQQVFPLEVGGTIVPTGAFKQAMYYGGQVDLLPRLKESFGTLLKGLLGAATAVTDTQNDGTANVGVNSHTFTFDPSSSFAQPWMATRCEIPGSTSADRYGETGFDCKLANLRLTIPAMGKLAARLTLVGRDATIERGAAVDAWTYANTDFEDSESAPDAGRGAFKLDGSEYPIVGAQIDFANNLTNPQQEMVIGDFHPDDFVALSRGATIRIVYKYQDPDLQQKILTGQASGTDWDSLPWISSTGDGGAGVPAFEAVFQSPGEIPGAASAIPYELRVVANRVTWAAQGPPELVGGGFLTQTFVGTVLEAASGEAYIEVQVQNEIASY